MTSLISDEFAIGAPNFLWAWRRPRGLGLDGEEPQGNEYLANQLGHANEAMVTRIYKSMSAARRRQLLAEAAKLKRAS